MTFRAGHERKEGISPPSFTQTASRSSGRLDSRRAGEQRCALFRSPHALALAYQEIKQTDHSIRAKTDTVSTDSQLAEFGELCNAYHHTYYLPTCPY